MSPLRPEFSGYPELYIRRSFKSFALAEISNELMWAVSTLVDRINA